MKGGSVQLRGCFLWKVEVQRLKLRFGSRFRFIPAGGCECKQDESGRVQETGISPMPCKVQMMNMQMQ